MHKILLLNSLFLGLTVPVLATFWLLPFDFFVDVKGVAYHDVCVGEVTQFVTADREVKFSEGYSGSASGEVFKFNEDGTKLETIIKREKRFAYQVSSEPVTYEVVWDTPFTKPGVYGASDLVRLYAPVFIKTKFFSEDYQKFNVKICD